MRLLILVVLASSLLPATAYFLLTSYRRWIALALCTLPPLAAWVLPELHHAALVGLSGMVAVTATLLLALFDLCSSPADRASFLRGGLTLTLVSSIPGFCAATVAFDFNPRREFCAGPVVASHCSLDYLELALFGLPFWGAVYTTLFLLIGEIGLIQVLFRRWKTARPPDRA
jgi:hypothetical protein